MTNDHTKELMEFVAAMLAVFPSATQAKEHYPQSCVGGQCVLFHADDAGAASSWCKFLNGQMNEAKTNPETVGIDGNRWALTVGVRPEGFEITARGEILLVYIPDEQVCLEYLNWFTAQLWFIASQEVCPFTLFSGTMKS